MALERERLENEPISAKLHSLQSGRVNEVTTSKFITTTREQHLQSSSCPTSLLDKHLLASDSSAACSLMLGLVKPVSFAQVGRSERSRVVGDGASCEVE